MKIFDFFTKYQSELALLQEILGLIASHTKNHNTVNAISEGITVAQGLAGQSAPVPTPATSAGNAVFAHPTG